jgi:ATP-dependent DNA helicase RecQ
MKAEASMLNQQLKKYFGFDSFLAGQKTVISRVLERKSSAAIFPTGAGKSLCYQLPAMLLPGMTLVVSPLLSLMKDQLDFLKDKKIPAARLDSTLESSDYNSIIEAARNGTLKILMISVERFKNERFRFHLEKMDVTLLVIDEAHCISEWGHNFRPEYLKLPAYQEAFGIEQILLLTATATKRVIEDMCTKFRLLRENVFVTGFYRDNLFLQVSPTTTSEKEDHLLQRIRKAPQAATIVYVTLQKTAERVAAFLVRQGIAAQPYHAGMQTVERERIQNDFMQGQMACVVATIAFGMGIDKRDIRRVIHFDLPKSIENYSQEIGRSGRDGEPALCEVLANRDTVHVLENFIYGDTPEKTAIRRLLETISGNRGFTWEIKAVRLSNELNIRLLPLRTLLVYLAMEKVIRPKFSYFEDYAFKYVSAPETILSLFDGERKAFVAAVMEQCQTKKVWTSVDIPAILDSYACDRQRIITALEYFDEKGWIELQARQTVEVYDILTQAFDGDDLTDKMHTLFKKKEALEIQRIHDVVAFFESDSCLSRQLAGYFGEKLDIEKCGHCSFCASGQAILEHTTTLKPLADYDYSDVSGAFSAAIGDSFSALNVTKFLCGIYTPAFSKLKIKSLPHFGIFEHYPFLEAKAWVTQMVKKRPESLN